MLNACICGDSALSLDPARGVADAFARGVGADPVLARGVLPATAPPRTSTEALRGFLRNSSLTNLWNFVEDFSCCIA